MVRRAETQRVHRRDRARAHGEDVAQDAADTGRRALIGLDIGGVVVALHLEDDAVAIIDIDHAGIFARSLDDARALGRQRAQPLLGGLVGAVLVPHGREDAELGKGRFAADQVQDALIFIRLQAVGGDQFGVIGRVLEMVMSSEVPAKKREKNAARFAVSLA